MALMHAVLLVLLFCFASSLFVQDPELEWERMETVIGEKSMEAPAPEPKLWKSSSNSGSLTPEAQRVPEYIIVSASKDQKEVFKPEKGARPLPNSVKEMLLGATVVPTTTTEKPRTRPDLVEILCHIDRMYVRIRREVFKTREAYKSLKLGTCPVNQGTREHYYFLYLLETDCGFKKEADIDELSIRNVLTYNPPGRVLRRTTFDIPLQCKFPRFFHSFKVGFYPKLLGGTVFKALQPKSSFTLTPQDASGNELTGDKTFTLGLPMYFEAKHPDGPATPQDQRIFINKCFMTASQNSNSNPKYTVIDNQGCMIDGKVTRQSKFMAGSSKMVQKISVGALIFKDLVSSSSPSQQLYMHCEMSLGKLSPSSKACNYDPATQMWRELYGDNSVCICCESTCPSAQPKASRNMISSHSWKVDFSRKDGYAAVDPRMKSLDADSFSLEDPDMTEHRDFLDYWEQDY